MEESLQNIIEILLRISQENGEIVINDTGGMFTFFSSILTSLIGAIVGGIMTIILFKKQGRIQFREQMRLECINVLLKDLICLKNNIYNIYSSIMNLYHEYSMNSVDLVDIQVYRREMNNKVKLDKIMDYVEENIIILDKYYKDIYMISNYKQHISNMMDRLQSSFLPYNITSYYYWNIFEEINFNITNNLPF